MLMKSSKLVLLKKLRLSQKFLRKMLCIRKAALRVGLKRPSMVVATLAL